MNDYSAPFATLAPLERYKLLCAVICPRPIALVTCVSDDGVVNAAPFSFFNVFSEDPALIVLGLRAALTGADWWWIALPLGLSLPLHLLDLRARL